MFRVAILSSPIISVPPTLYGGTERVIDELIKRLVEIGLDVTLIAPGDSDVSCKLIQIPEKSLPFLTNKVDDDKLIPARKAAEKQAIEYIKNHLDEFDIVHSHGIDVIELHDLIPCVTTIHGAFNTDNFDYFNSRKILNYISISENQQRGFPSLNFVGIVYDGLDTRDFPIVTAPEHYMAFLARLDEEKCPHEAIQLAIHLYEKYGLGLKIAGKIDHGGAEYFKTQVKPFFNNPQYPYIEYLGELGMKDKIDLVSKAKIFLQPIKFVEPFGLGPLEAMMCGTPVIARNLGSMSELIIEGETGFRVENYPNETYHLIDECLKLDRFTIAKTTRMRFNSQKMALDYISCYQKVIENFHSQSQTT
jgi:glycosyltransferase involved in cell wall biosynthesis